jgi:HK97 family phage prohead protease
MFETPDLFGMVISNCSEAAVRRLPSADRLMPPRDESRDADPSAATDPYFGLRPFRGDLDVMGAMIGSTRALHAPREIELRRTAHCAGSRGPIGGELRMAGPGVLVGYSAVYNTLSNPLRGPGGFFRERLLPGCFDASINAPGADIRALAEHDSGSILGRTRSGTLTLSTDAVGVKFRLTLPNTSVGRDVEELVRRSDLVGCSFGFTVEQDHWDTEDGVSVRNVKRGRMFEMSIVGAPAYPATSVAAA